ncbi:WecB/TagA/CpsF family glycosyltransferase [Archangium sp.]|uniref:WecB/TagA/CpsF family glycosyltransferase n=1 Tax=Archangium sp. TaxID=1872627 RepID=UPI002ED8DFAF
MRLNEVLWSIESLVASDMGGRVLMPDVEQVVRAEHDKALREALATAELSLAGSPALVRAARVMGQPLPESRAGAEWLPPLARRACERAWRVFVVAERPGVAERTACLLRDRYGVLAVGATSPRGPVDTWGQGVDRFLDRIALTRPQLVLVSMATPKQELFCQYAAAHLQSAVLLGLGRTLESSWDEDRPAPRWRALGRLGWRERCQWLVTAPARLLHRKLSFFRILLRARRPSRLALPAGASS